MGSLADRIKAAQDLPREKVPCPEWDTDLWVRTPAGGEREAWEGSNVVASGKNTSIVHVQMRARLLVKVIEDESGKAVFSDDDVAWLTTKSALVLDRLFDVATRLAGITKGDEKKSSAPTPAADSPTGSPVN